jgi:hypothetical protein
MRKRAEIVERSFAHTLERGGMRRTWLRGRENVHKRYLIHVAGHNLGILMRHLIGAGTPRGRRPRPGALRTIVRRFSMRRSSVAGVSEAVCGFRRAVDVFEELLERLLLTQCIGRNDAWVRKIEVLGDSGRQQTIGKQVPEVLAVRLDRPSVATAVWMAWSAIWTS